MKRVLFALGLMAVTNSATAATLGTASLFNAFIFGNANTNINAGGGESEGAMAIGGNWTIRNGYRVTNEPNFGIVGSQNKIGVYVGGDVTVQSGQLQLNNGSNAYVGGTLSGSVLYNGGTGSLNPGNNRPDLSVFDTQKALSLSQADALMALPGTAINTSDMNNLRINLPSSGGSSLYVYTIAAAALAANRTLDVINLKSDQTLIINVLGNTATDFGVVLNSNQLDRILWNFANVPTLNVNRNLRGSLLAPRATVNQYENIDGTLITQNWNMFSRELHNGPGQSFSSNILPSLNTVNPVPEPGTIAFGISTLVMGGLLMRRRRHLP